jgi:hypothetical protein
MAIGRQFRRLIANCSDRLIKSIELPAPCGFAGFFVDREKSS